MVLRLNREGIKQKYSYQKMTISPKFIDLNSPPVVGKKNGTERDLENQQKMITESSGRKK